MPELLDRDGEVQGRRRLRHAALLVRQGDDLSQGCSLRGGRPRTDANAIVERRPTEAFNSVEASTILLALRVPESGGGRGTLQETPANARCGAVSSQPARPSHLAPCFSASSPTSGGAPPRGLASTARTARRVVGASGGRLPRAAARSSRISARSTDTAARLAQPLDPLELRVHPRVLVHESHGTPPLRAGVVTRCAGSHDPSRRFRGRRRRATKRHARADDADGRTRARSGNRRVEIARMSRGSPPAQGDGSVRRCDLVGSSRRDDAAGRRPAAAGGGRAAPRRATRRARCANRAGASRRARGERASARGRPGRRRRGAHAGRRAGPPRSRAVLARAARRPAWLPPTAPSSQPSSDSSASRSSSARTGPSWKSASSQRSSASRTSGSIAGGEPLVSSATSGARNGSSRVASPGGICAASGGAGPHAVRPPVEPLEDDRARGDARRGSRGGAR